MLSVVSLSVAIMFRKEFTQEIGKCYLMYLIKFNRSLGLYFWLGSLLLGGGLEVFGLVRIDCLVLLAFETWSVS